MRAPLIGLSGKKRSGKDTAAEALIVLGYKRFAFADIMKEAALALDPIVHVEQEWDDLDVYQYVIEARLSDVVSMHGWEQAKEYPEVRRTLQRLGTEVGRNLFGENFWVEHTMNAIREHDGPAVITDVRFPNEARAIEREGLSYLIRIERPGLEAGDDHPSETALDEYDFEEVVTNDASIDALHRHITDYATFLDTLQTQAR